MSLTQWLGVVLALIAVASCKPGLLGTKLWTYRLFNSISYCRDRAEHVRNMHSLGRPDRRGSWYD